MKTENDILKILLKEEQDWIAFAKHITKDHKTDYRDLLQDLYVKIHEKVDKKNIEIDNIMYNDKVNKSFIYTMMQNIFQDQLRKKSEYNIEFDLSNEVKFEDEPYIDREQIVDDIVSDFYWFDRKLFNLYRKEFHSIRKLAEETGISHVVVWRTINNCIKEIKKKINEK